VLPDYMIPTRWLLTDRLPLSPHGKVDRRRLPAPHEAPAADAEAEAISPEGPLELAVALIWKEVMQVERLPRELDFFLAGGHSLHATRIVSEIRDMFGIELSMADLFHNATVAELAVRMESLSGDLDHLHRLARQVCDVMQLSDDEIDSRLEEGIR
jgi:acyl carrier protein